jgi:hypothetical protein
VSEAENGQRRNGVASWRSASANENEMAAYRQRRMSAMAKAMPLYRKKPSKIKKLAKIKNGGNGKHQRNGGGGSSARRNGNRIEINVAKRKRKQLINNGVISSASMEMAKKAIRRRKLINIKIMASCVIINQYKNGVNNQCVA